MIRVLVVDDEALVRSGLRMILEAAGDMAVVGEASDGAAAVVVTLPAPTTAGLQFLIGTRATPASTVRFTAGGTLVKGAVLASNGAAAASAIIGPGAFVGFTATAIVGDYIDLVSDGVNWCASGQTQATAGIAFA